MKRKTAKIHPKAHRQFKAFSRKTGVRMEHLIDEALFAYWNSMCKKKVQRSNDEE